MDPDVFGIWRATCMETWSEATASLDTLHRGGMETVNALNGGELEEALDEALGVKP